MLIMMIKEDEWPQCPKLQFQKCSSVENYDALTSTFHHLTSKASSDQNSADGVSALQLQSSGTHFRHGCALPPLVVNNSEMDFKPSSSYKPTHDLLRTLVLV